MAEAIVSGIYAITNKQNGKKYIGSAVNFATRFSGHKNRLRRGNHHSAHLQNAWNKYGEDCFEFSIIEGVDRREDLIKVEQKYIDFLNPEYNVCKVAGSPLGVKQSAEARAKKSDALTGRIHSEESIAKMIASKAASRNQYLENTKVFKLDRELKKRIRRAKSIAKGSNKRQITKEHREKLSAAKIGKPFSDEHKKALSEAAKKRGAPVLSFDSRARGNAKRTGVKRTEEQISRMRHAAVGRKWPEETVRKRAESLRRTLEAKKAAKQQATT